MKRILLIFSLVLTAMIVMAQKLSCCGATQCDKRARVELITSKGRIVVELYNETPCHRDNFLKLTRQGVYDGVLWHRVIANFMIQSGDTTSRHALPGDLLGEGDLNYTLDAEIKYPKIFHKRGALAAARESDDVNPARKSSAAQFYIVWGKVYDEAGLDQMQAKIDKRTNGTVRLTPEVRQYYIQYGGTPHLDGQYTVFGEVVEGLDVVEKIDFVKTDSNDRPVEDVKIIRATVLP